MRGISKVVATLGIIAGIFSVIGLIRQGFSYGLGCALGTVIDHYDKLTRAVLGWADPFVDRFAAIVGDFIGMQWHVLPYWKHVFIIMGIYFSRHAATAYSAGNRGTAVFYGLFGLLISLLASVFAGLGPSASSSQTNITVALIPVAGVAIYEMGSYIWDAIWHRKTLAERHRTPIISFWQYIDRGLFFALLRFVIAIAVVGIGLALPFVNSLENPGLAVLGLLSIALACYWLWLGSKYAPAIRDEGESAYHALNREGNWRLGTAMLVTLAGVVIFLLLDAGFGSIESTHCRSA